MLHGMRSTQWAVWSRQWIPLSLAHRGQRRVQVMSVAHIWPQESPSQVNWLEKAFCWSRCLTNLKITAGMVRAPGKGVNWSQRPETAAQSLLSAQDKAENVAPSSLCLLLSSHPLPRDLLLARQRPALSSISVQLRGSHFLPWFSEADLRVKKWVWR